MSQSKRNPHLPPWLQDVPLPPRPPNVDQPAGGAPLFAGLPEWLRDENEIPSSTTPDWLSQTPAPPHPEPDWLPVPDQTAHLPSETTALPEVSPPSWLQSLRETIVPPEKEAGNEPLPSTFATKPGDVPQTGSSGSEMEVPSWLIGEQLDRGSDESAEQPASSAFPPLSGAADETVEPVDLPAWLRELPVDNASQLSPSSRIASRGEELPAWLRQDEPSITASPEDSRSASDLPDWLRDIAAVPPAPPAAPVAPVAETAPPASDLPDWLRDIAAQPAASPAAPSAPVAETAPPASDLPDWLRDIAAVPPAPPAAPVAPVAETAPPASDLPDWLRDIAAVPPAPPAAPSAPVAETAPPASDLPDWLRDIAAQPAASPAAPSAPVAETAPPASDLPDWLTGTLSTPDIPSVEEKPVAPPSTPSDLPDWLQAPDASPGATGLPDWLRGAEVPAATDAYDGRSYTTEPAALRGSSDLLSGMDLPEWLRVEPEPKPEPPLLSGRDLDWLTRLGSIAEDETITGVTVTTPKLPPPPAPKRTEEQLAALNLLSRLAAEPIPAATPLPHPEPTGALQRIGLERMISMVLLILVTVAIIIPGLVPALETPPIIPDASEVHQQIAALGANDVVLIGYEWDARRVGELRPLEQAVIGQLIAQNVKLILVSTDPQGTLLQFDLLDTLRQAGYRQQGEGYLLLGYKPGGEMALRMVGRDFQTVLRSDYRGDDATGSVLITGVDTGRPIERLNDLSLIIVLADDTPDVQGWMEQVYPQAQMGDRPVSLVFLLPEEAAPIVQPYMRQPGVIALAGHRGALAYAALEQNAGSFDPMVARSIAQQRLATLLFALVLLFGLAGVGIAALRRRRL
ncbi:MAG: hypothetical protein J7463_10570 [Roseiflexus sp.]|nr:hypothetical protein [Roseiflexus sp.]